MTTELSPFSRVNVNEIVSPPVDLKVTPLVMVALFKGAENVNLILGLRFTSLYLNPEKASFTFRLLKPNEAGIPGFDGPGASFSDLQETPSQMIEQRRRRCLKGIISLLIPI
jgi:hypothetical protein